MISRTYYKVEEGDSALAKREIAYVHGRYSHTIDPKGRLIIPSKFREQLGDEFVLTKGLMVVFLSIR